MDEENKSIVSLIISILIGALLLGLIIFGWQWFKVFSAEQSGKAELAQAEFNRQITVREAQAHLDSAKLLAEAEIERSKGVKQANEIIAGSLKGHEEYLRYLWIQNVSVGEHQIIYVPTETNLPILEATRLK